MTIKLFLPKELYTKETILKTVCLYNNLYNFDINTDDKSYILEIDPSNNNIFDEVSFFSKLQEQQLREILNNQFGELRETIYQKAFSLIE